MTLDQLHARGFDRSTAYREDEEGERYLSVRCSQCEACVINGTPCHENGCTNIVHECKGCNAAVLRRGAYCGECSQ